MDDTIRRLAKLLGGSGFEVVGSDARFAVDGTDGSRLKVNIEGAQQRLMAVLLDAAGVARADIDVAPILKVTEDPAFPGRVTIHFKSVAIHIDSKPTLAVAVLSEK
jgi:hypothetical protein